MIETILKVDGMMCGMCESHVILSEQELDIDALKAAIAETGYTVKGAQSHPYEKKGFLSSLFHK